MNGIKGIKRKWDKLRLGTSDSLLSSSDSDNSLRGSTIKVKDAERGLGFELDKVNARQKKTSQVNMRERNCVEIKGSKKNPQVVVSCTPAGYELLKSELTTYLTKTLRLQLIHKIKTTLD